VWNPITDGKDGNCHCHCKHDHAHKHRRVLVHRSNVCNGSKADIAALTDPSELGKPAHLG